MAGLPLLFFCFSVTHVYTWVKGHTVRVQDLAQEHNTMTQPEIKPNLQNSESGALIINSLCLPQSSTKLARQHRGHKIIQNCKSTIISMNLNENIT